VHSSANAADCVLREDARSGLHDAMLRTRDSPVRHWVGPPVGSRAQCDVYLAVAAAIRITLLRLML
jgi:hypothetical protein